MKTGFLILAAGAAKRMQQPKMLLPFGEETILSHIIGEVKAAGAHTICLVTGYYHEEIIRSIDIENILVTYNENWEEGMAGSIRKGLSSLIEKYPGMRSVMIMVSDQPYLHHELLQNMMEQQQRSGKGIVAASYSGIQGTPVLFERKYFEQLQELKSDNGAKPILQQYSTDVITVDFPSGNMDIDTLEDYEKFCAKIKQQNA
ncbi:MAG: nucleotidyltransferase family protein [Bacteroidota bacterium]